MQDGQGSTRNLTDSSGNVTDSYSYTAFGEIYNQTGTTENKYLYTGQQYDSGLGLYSLRARYYDPSNGRFLSQDTYSVNFSNPIELNRYGYAANNVINLSDPRGLNSASEYPSPWMALSAFGGTESLKAVAYYTTAVLVVGAIIFLVAQDVVAYAPPAPNTIDRLKVFEDWWEKFQNDSGGSGGGKPSWGQIVLTIISILVLTGQFFPPATDTGNPPVPTEEPPFIIRHYTSQSSLNKIISMGFTMIPDPLSFPGRKGAIFFTDTSPIHGGYDRLFIAAALGIDYANTESFIDIDMNKVGEPTRWHNRITATGITEYYYMTNDPISVANGFIQSGNVSDLP